MASCGDCEDLVHWVSNQMRFNGELSGTYSMERQGKLGSVLYPALFILVMDPLLKELQVFGLGLYISE